ncbi:hypothetical protein NDN08_002208 [Rhodosorus marinus]|uniref:Protein BTN n=1 Tax=Rhodosorus marinus TaxID=101924 RepID=A0AAV8UT62_9RHOD|nr:hypothetical protein NDN08_002208 [Rhodosorus marinus]
MDLEVIAFGICGLLLDMTFVVLLAAAKDIVSASSLPTSSVLVASIVPLWFLKLVAPLFIEKVPYRVKISAAAWSGMLALCGTALLSSIWGKLVVGVAVGAISTALAEITFFALVTRYSKQCLPALTTGTGLCGLCGSGFYFFFTEVFKFSSKVTLLITSILPLSLIFVHGVFLTPEPGLNRSNSESAIAFEFPGAYDATTEALLSPNSSTNEQEESSGVPRLSLREKTDFVFNKLLFPSMIPLFLIFFTGYLMTQAVVPEITFDSKLSSPQGQYSLFLFIASIGGVLSRASLYFVEVDNLYLLTGVQTVFLLVLILEIHRPFLPSLMSMLFIALAEGAISGLVFVNAFRLINNRADKTHIREFAMGVVSVADATGVLVAAAVGLSLEPYLAHIDELQNA